MESDMETKDTSAVIATIENTKDKGQTVDIVYLREMNAFVTSGIWNHFAEKEMLIPAHLVIDDIELMGTIVSAILEELSKSRDRESTFKYPEVFEVLGETYTMTEDKGYMRLDKA